MDLDHITSMPVCCPEMAARVDSDDQNWGLRLVSKEVVTEGEAVSLRVQATSYPNDDVTGEPLASCPYCKAAFTRSGETG